MRRLLDIAKRFWRSICKEAGRFADPFRPQGRVEARLIWAHGEKRGQVYKRFRGRNVVTSWLSVDGAAPTSGRDLMRRLLVPASFSGSLAADSDAVISQMQLGSGTTAEKPEDTALGALITGTTKDITEVSFDGTGPDVTFIAQYDESEANVTISEAALLSARGDFVARKTFGGISKTSAFLLELRWTIRFE